MFDGLKMCSPRHVITYFESSETAAVPAKIHQPCMLHQSPCCVPGTRRTNATPLPVSSALAGHMSTCCWRNAIADLEHRARDERDRGSARSRAGSGTPTWPSTCSEVIIAARCSRGSRSFGSSDRVRRAADRERAAAGGRCGMRAHAPMLVRRANYESECAMKLERARAIVDFVVSEAPGAGLGLRRRRATASSSRRRRWTAPRPTRG